MGDMDNGQNEGVRVSAGRAQLLNAALSQDGVGECEALLSVPRTIVLVWRRSKQRATGQGPRAMETTRTVSSSFDLVR